MFGDVYLGIEFEGPQTVYVDRYIFFHFYFSSLIFCQQAAGF